MKIPVNKIKINSAVSVREKNDEETIQRYMDVLENLPPITVFHTDDQYLLADGFHRWAAAVKRGLTQIEAEVREGSYEEACEYAITANLKHGKPLTSQEYEQALRRLMFLHPDWSHRKLANELARSPGWVDSISAADRVEKVHPGMQLPTRTKTEISRAPQSLWADIAAAAQEQSWSRDETLEKVQRIKAEPERAQEIIQPVRIEVPEAPSDKLIPLTKEINKLCEMQDQFCDKLDPRLYDWGSGALAVHVLHGLYVLAEKTTQLADKTKRMIEFLEARGKGKGRRE